MKMKRVCCVYYVTFATIFISRCVYARHAFEGIPQHIVERWHRIPRPGDSIKSLDGSAPKNISHVCCETSEYKCCIFLPEREPDDENVRIRTTAIVFAKLVEALPRRFVMSVLAVVFAVHFGLFVFNNTKPTTMSNYVLSVAAMSRHGVASAQSILELVVAATQMYTVGKDDEWEDLTNDPYGRDVRVRRLIGRLQKLRKKNEALVVREQRQRSIMHKTAMSVVDKKSKYQSLQKLLKFEYIQLQIFENILMEELTDVGPDQFPTMKNKLPVNKKVRFNLDKLEIIPMFAEEGNYEDYYVDISQELSS